MKPGLTWLIALGSAGVPGDTSWYDCPRPLEGACRPAGVEACRDIEMGSDVVGKDAVSSSSGSMVIRGGCRRVEDSGMSVDDGRPGEPKTVQRVCSSEEDTWMRRGGRQQVILTYL